MIPLLPKKKKKKKWSEEKGEKKKGGGGEIQVNSELKLDQTVEDKANV